MQGKMEIKNIYTDMPLNLDNKVTHQDEADLITKKTDTNTNISETEDDLAELDFSSTSDNATITDSYAIRDYINNNLSFDDKELILKESNGFFNISSLQIKDNKLESIATKDDKIISYSRLKNPNPAQQNSIEKTISSKKSTDVSVNTDINAEFAQTKNLSQSQSATDDTNNHSFENTTETNAQNTGSEVVRGENINGRDSQTDNSYASNSNNISNQTNIFEGKASDYENLSPLESSDSQLNSLIQEQIAAVKDLNQQQTKYQQTQDEANEALGQINSDIQTQQTNLEDAQTDKQDA